MFSSLKSGSSTASARLIAILVIATVLSCGASVTAASGQAKRKHIAHKQAPAPDPEEAPKPQPEPIPRMTMEDLPTQPPRVTYSRGVLTLDSDNTNLGEALAAINEKTALEIDPMPESAERFPAHFSGTPREVIAQLLSGSEFGYVMVASRDDPSTLNKLILTRLLPGLPADPNRSAMANLRRTPSPRAALFVPPESVAERRGETILDANAKPPSADDPVRESTQTPPVVLPVPGAPQQPASTADGAAPSDTRSAQPGAAENGKQQVNAAGQYMQELYRMRLQQGQPAGSVAPAPPQ